MTGFCVFAMLTTERKRCKIKPHFFQGTEKSFKNLGSRIAYI
jgi:hypothetical protein